MAGLANQRRNIVASLSRRVMVVIRASGRNHHRIDRREQEAQQAIGDDAAQLEDRDDRHGVVTARVELHVLIRDVALVADRLERQPLIAASEAEQVLLGFKH